MQRQVSLPCLKHSLSCHLGGGGEGGGGQDGGRGQEGVACCHPAAAGGGQRADAGGGGVCRLQVRQNLMYFNYYFGLLLFMNFQSRELECPVCLTEMLPPIRIWQVQPSLKENICSGFVLFHFFGICTFFL